MKRFVSVKNGVDRLIRVEHFNMYNIYIFDTDHLSLIQRNGIEGKRILAKLSAIK